MMFLKAQWELFGLKAPVFSWIVSIGLIAYSIYVYVRVYAKSWGQARLYSIAEGRLTLLRETASPGPGKGISRQFYDSIDEIFDTLPLLRASWLRISSFVISRTDKNGEERFWMSEDLGGFLNEERMVDSQSYRSAPAVISGVGLLATFLAILVALLDVRLTNNKVQGLDLLLQGLSGKFLSSVVAIGCATMLTHAERGVFRKARAGLASFAATLASLIPRLVPAQVLSDIFREIAEQKRDFKAFDADFAGRIKRGFGENLDPAAERIVSAIEQMSRYLKQSDALQQESMSKQMAASQRDLGRSLNSALERLSIQLKDSLARGGQGQPGRISESLSETAALLREISSQLALNQKTFDETMRSTKTAAPAALNETTLAAMIEETSERSAGKIKEALDQAGSFNPRREDQLAELLEKHGAELTRVEYLRVLLDDTLKKFVTSHGVFGQMAEGLQTAGSQLDTTVASLNQLAKSVVESQGAAARILSSSSSQIESLEGLSQGQRETWERIRASMSQYEEVFERVEGHAKDLLAHIARHLGGYSTTTQNHFVQLTSAADNFISQATGKLSVSIDELSEQLDELHTVVADMAQVSQGAR
jgi:hypothetical protein